jgi:hypothetical protein
VVGSGPAPHVWERIEQRVGRPTVWDLMGLGFSWSYRAVMAWLSRMDLFVGVQVVAWPWPENRWEWRRDPRSTRFLDQYTFLLQLAF